MDIIKIKENVVIKQEDGDILLEEGDSLRLITEASYPLADYFDTRNAKTIKNINDFYKLYSDEDRNDSFYKTFYKAIEISLKSKEVSRIEYDSVDFTLFIYLLKDRFILRIIPASNDPDRFYMHIASLDTEKSQRGIAEVLPKVLPLMGNLGSVMWW